MPKQYWRRFRGQQQQQLLLRRRHSVTPGCEAYWNTAATLWRRLHNTTIAGGYLQADNAETFKVFEPHFYRRWWSSLFLNISSDVEVTMVYVPAIGSIICTCTRGLLKKSNPPVCKLKLFLYNLNSLSTHASVQTRFSNNKEQTGRTETNRKHLFLQDTHNSGHAHHSAFVNWTR